MNKFLTTCIAVSACLFSAAAQGAPGEYWEVTSKMEMPGMPFAMPETKQKVCIAKGGENDPKKTSGDKDCQMTDVKTVGNKTTWKMRCNHNGDVMTGSGEQTVTANGYKGKMQYSGKSRGSNMSMAYSGKRLGGSCDSGEAVKKAKEEQQKITAQMCDTSHYRDTEEWINVSDLILPENSPCADQRKQLCDLVHKDTPTNIKAYVALRTHEQDIKQYRNRTSIVRECKLDMAATTKEICGTLSPDNYDQLSGYCQSETKALCKTINGKNFRKLSEHCPTEAKALCKTISGKNYDQLSGYCPAEAKSFREIHRRDYCEGRSYTAETRDEDLKRCLSGKDYENPEDEEPVPASSAKSSSSNPASSALEGAKKLKGMFGF